VMTDAEGKGAAIRDIEGALRQEHPEAVLISARKGWNLDSLLRAVELQLAAVDTRSPASA